MIFQRCAAMDAENNCKRCPGYCSFAQHYHARKMMQTKEQKLTTVLEDIKAKFDLATRNRNDFEQKLNSTQGSRKLMEQVLRQKLDTIQAQCRELRKVCGGFNLAEELYTLVEQLKIEAQTLTSLEARHQAEIVIRELNMLCQNLQAHERNTTTSKSEMAVVDTGSGSEKTASKFLFNAQNKAQESNERLTAAERILQAQIKKKKTPASIENTSDPSVYEPVDGEYEEQPQVRNYPKSSRKEKPKSEQPPALPKWLPLRMNQSNDDHASSTMYTPDTQYGSIYSSQPSHSKATTAKYESLSIRELVDELHAAMAQNRSKVVIERELHNRAQGITCPMITISDRTAFTRYTSKYSRLSPSEISLQYMRLQKHVHRRLGDDHIDIEKIITIPSELLIELAALYTLFSSTDSAVSNRDGTDYQYNDYSRLSSAASCSSTRSPRDGNFEADDDRYRQRSIHRSTPAKPSKYTDTIDRDYDNLQTRSRDYTQGNLHAPPSYDDAMSRENDFRSQTRGASSGQAQKEREVG